MTRALHSTEQALAWLHERMADDAGTLRTDSRLVNPGDAFIAWPGATADGRAFLSDARARGACACLVEAAGADRFDLAGEDVATLAGLKQATGDIAAAWFAHPSRGLPVVAFTGTNGKTSSAWWLAGALSKYEHSALAPCALVGTLGMGFLPSLQATGLTTPDPVRLQSGLRSLVDAGARSCAIEASSIGLAEHRLVGLNITVAVFTNFTHDHLDYHRTVQAYWAAKRSLFSWPGLRAAVVHIDDAAGAGLHAELMRQQTLDVWSVSQTQCARLRASEVRATTQGLRCQITEGEQTFALQTALIGQYNLDNLLGVLAALRALGVPLVQAVKACGQLLPVPGRMERMVRANQPLVAVDYAHTPDALAKALQALQPLAKQRGGRLWCVFGCGGDRDPTKRPRMGAAAQQNADEVLVTSDNPRSEDPVSIVREILQGTVAGPVLRTEPDRAAAIALALAEAAPADVVLIAGKGHETWQEIAGERHPFVDLEHARAALERRP